MKRANNKNEEDHLLFDFSPIKKSRSFAIFLDFLRNGSFVFSTFYTKFSIFSTAFSQVSICPWYLSNYVSIEFKSPIIFIDSSDMEAKSLTN